ncbi:hypothetical protein B0H67DRAFT_587288 [Lasiosphaeris hirsuta]|uniref:Secreted protein n=1 Tax=Lasiosphaeris hirsuta TaxID=260670 RepID=A0AA40DPH0_9PEZI|nr:hypothetical protein B0H67DRAFT_587288 [Lasiosphaeris hirsuta]
MALVRCLLVLLITCILLELGWEVMSSYYGGIERTRRWYHTHTRYTFLDFQYPNVLRQAREYNTRFRHRLGCQTGGGSELPRHSGHGHWANPDL